MLMRWVLHRNAVLVTLTLVYMISSLDQSLMALMAEPIRVSLGLTDAQLGALTGLAFGVLYSTVGLPAAHWADRGNRVKITALAIGVWGLAVSGCLFVSGFVQLAVSRALAGIGAASCMPPTYSLIGDYFPSPAERPRVMAVYMLSGPVGALVSYCVGGWLAQHYDWRVAFFALGIPGIVSALAVPLFVKDPRRNSNSAPDPSHKPVSMWAVLRYLWRHRSIRNLSLAFVLFLTLTGGMASWFAVFLIRSHGMSTSTLGAWFGLIFGVSGTVGIILGGVVSGRWFGSDEETQMRLCSLFIACLTAFYAAFLLISNTGLVLSALFLLILAGNFVVGPTFALVQRLVPELMRARSMAWIMLAANLIGMSIGPEIIGALSDRLNPHFGSQSLRYSMLIVSSLALCSAYSFWCVSRTVKADLRKVAQGCTGSEHANTVAVW
jgi:MFS family permease